MPEGREDRVLGEGAGLAGIGDGRQRAPSAGAAQVRPMRSMKWAAVDSGEVPSGE
jgi:hypothetical protein